MNDSLGDRMKEYEPVTQTHLVRRMPAILRLDGRAFHTFTKKMKKPFDDYMFALMHFTAYKLVQEIQTSVLAYCQSDEISILLKDYSKIETQAWFGGNVQKMVSISAALATAYFNRTLLPGLPENDTNDDVPPVFDSRIFNVPKEDVVNYFIWRQKDATRNSINAVGQANFSHSQLQGKSQNDVLDMLHDKGINWNDTPTKFKRGFCIVRGPVEVKVAGITTKAEGVHADTNIPIFTENREYISRFLEAEV